MFQSTPHHAICFIFYCHSAANYRPMCYYIDFRQNRGGGVPCTARLTSNASLHYYLLTSPEAAVTAPPAKVSWPRKPQQSTIRSTTWLFTVMVNVRPAQTRLRNCRAFDVVRNAENPHGGILALDRFPLASRLEFSGYLEWPCDMQVRELVR